jgi:hypothetical protein
MIAEKLSPSLELLTRDYVLVQAWKKTAAHIRQHNWYSDTLELDRAAVNLPQFLGELAEQLQSPEQWQNDSLRIVPAPKNQRWRVTKEKQWEPVEFGKIASKLRPLAHVTLKDQVAATAIMLCLADRVETAQGDPRSPMLVTADRQRIISYGNRLFCDSDGEALQHRWGSSKLYRSYYQDYQTFLRRPDAVANAASDINGQKLMIVQSDLRQFYDRVRPASLIAEIEALSKPGDDPRFYDLVHRVLNWSWNGNDKKEVEFYAQQSGLSEFSAIALPQGLVSAGFFANIALLDFDDALRGAFNQELVPATRLLDACRYVDDLRLVISVSRTSDTAPITTSKIAADWLQTQLDHSTSGLLISEEKTRTAEVQGDEQPLVKQSRKMARIQHAVSGGFDAIGGEEILDAIQGLVQSQHRYSDERAEDQGWPFMPIPDVRDATVARFAAGRYRRTYRSLRPLLAGRDERIDTEDSSSNNREASQGFRSGRTQLDLDNEARAFALGLIENWVEDPSNVRLLRIGLDLWPATDVLKEILGLLRPFTEKGGRRKAPRRVAWYCLSEILRAGATETGLVDDGDVLPDAINIDVYRATLAEEAVRLLSLPAVTLPWYLKQQALLFLAATVPDLAPLQRTGNNPETKHYRELIRFLRGEADRLTNADFVTLAILARRSFIGKEAAVGLIGTGITLRRLEQIAERDPSFGMELIAGSPSFIHEISARLRVDLCLSEAAGRENVLSRRVLGAYPDTKLRNELSLLSFALAFIDCWLQGQVPDVLTPSEIELATENGIAGTERVVSVTFNPSHATPTGSMYQPPPWAASDKWRFQLGYLIRFILAGKEDFTKLVRPPSWREDAKIYRPAESHWYQRLYGLFNGHSAFGDDWLPISEWIEQLLFALLTWPGCRTSGGFGWVQGGISEVRTKLAERLSLLEGMQGKPSSSLIIPLAAPHLRTQTKIRPLRACVVQTVIPNDGDFHGGVDLTLSANPIRKSHRRHLSAALAAVERSLALRETHKGQDGRLDWLILPELSVHPDDIRTHLIPFARAHKSIILAGLTYQNLLPNQLLVNSAIWIIPVSTPTSGLQVLVRRQGKKNLAPEENKLNSPTPLIQGFRPCQWLVGYEWSGAADDRPLNLTAAICYDATDLTLAANLRGLSDVFAISALNKDVGTFDQMALALHYHMFQMVVVANNGSYGGSNAYAPYKDSYRKQVLHLHGQPQAAIGFFEIDDIKHFIERPGAGAAGKPEWKSPPVGL